MKPRLLDLFCGAGGAAMGYHRAGFDVVGVDINPQPHYPFEFHQADAFEFLCAYRGGDYGGDFDVIHASPPCQSYSSTRNLHDAEYPDLIGKLRETFDFMGVDYIIENVVGAPLLNPIKLCGSSFGLRVRRHRLFESSVLLSALPCDHKNQGEIITVTGGGPNPASFDRPKGGGPHRKPRNVPDALDAMGIDWPMTRAEVNESIPPAYTEFIGEHLIRYMGSHPRAGREEG
jgi:DNA (cytosine-5)-methyltransferase 1